LSKITSIKGKRNFQGGRNEKNVTPHFQRKMGKVLLKKEGRGGDGLVYVERGRMDARYREVWGRP